MPSRSPFEPPVGGLSLYVHVPFCQRKCNYCAFESAAPRAGDIELWLNSLEKEIAWWGSRVGKVSLNTCYIGGGTPTLLDGLQWTRLCAVLEAGFDFGRSQETTVEANPNSLTAEQLLIWRGWRVSRVSVGVQSFDEAELRMLGRLHSPGEACCALSSALAAGFQVNADLMFGLPHQTLHNWGRTLREAVKSGVGHISLYQLSLEPNTPWSGLDPSLLPDGYAQYRWAQWYLPRHGFGQYEIANFAQTGRESRHNLNYWREGEYLGIGPGASGYLGGWRYKNLGGLAAYAGAVNSGVMPVAGGERLTMEERACEAAVLALRTARGIPVGDYEREYGARALTSIKSVLKELPGDLCEISEGQIALTKKGMRVANRIWVELV